MPGSNLDNLLITSLHFVPSLTPYKINLICIAYFTIVERQKVVEKKMYFHWVEAGRTGIKIIFIRWKTRSDFNQPLDVQGSIQIQMHTQSKYDGLSYCIAFYVSLKILFYLTIFSFLSMILYLNISNAAICFKCIAIEYQHKKIKIDLVNCNKRLQM